MPTTIESIIISAWLILLCASAIVLSRRLARWLQRSRGEQPTKELHSRYRWGIIFGAIGGLIIVGVVGPLMLDLVSGPGFIFIGLPLAFIAFWAAQAKLTRESS